MIDTKKLYDQRFTTFERIRKNELWKIICSDFLQQFIKKRDTVLDVGAGHCEFINNIRADKRIALDINNNLRKFASNNVEVKIAPVKRLRNIFPERSLDVVFMSNLLEHLNSKEDVFRLINEAYFVLKKGGRLLIMQPDISLVGNDYWDFFDHKVPITFASLLEVVHANKFKLKYSRYPFLPYTTKTRYLPLWPLLLKVYLKIRPLHYIFGKQFFLCVEK